jgi:DNA-binding transcriptional ArsR family regulator
MLLTKEKLSINALAGNFDISRPAVSKHVKVLYEAGLIVINDQGRERYCELKPDGFDDIKNWLIFFDQFWKEKLRNLENLLNQKSN